VAGQIINGNRWIAERLKFLRSRLAEDVSDDDRKAIEAEIEILTQERGLTAGGFPLPRFLRRLRLRKPDS
jgi:hypothetical protein